MVKGMDQNSQWKQAFPCQRPLVQQAMARECHCDTKIKTLAYGFVLIIGDIEHSPFSLPMTTRP